jgi:hypothetical protein
MRRDYRRGRNVFFEEVGRQLGGSVAIIEL